jgi:hypothetical protein
LQFSCAEFLLRYFLLEQLFPFSLEASWVVVLLPIDSPTTILQGSQCKWSAQNMLPRVARSVAPTLLLHWMREVGVLSFGLLARLLQAFPGPFPFSALPRSLHTPPVSGVLVQGVLPPYKIMLPVHLVGSSAPVDQLKLSSSQLAMMMAIE